MNEDDHDDVLRRKLYYLPSKEGRARIDKCGQKFKLATAQNDLLRLGRWTIGVDVLCCASCQTQLVVAKTLT